MSDAVKEAWAETATELRKDRDRLAADLARVTEELRERDAEVERVTGGGKTLSQLVSGVMRFYSLPDNGVRACMIGMLKDRESDLARVTEERDAALAKLVGARSGDVAALIAEICTSFGDDEDRMDRLVRLVDDLAYAAHANGAEEAESDLARERERVTVLEGAAVLLGKIRMAIKQMTYFRLPDGVVVRRSRTDRTDWIVEQRLGGGHVLLARREAVDAGRARPWMIGPNDDVFYESAEEAFRSILSACQPRDGDRFNGPATDEDRERLGMVINYSEAMIAALSPPPGDACTVASGCADERERLRTAACAYACNREGEK